MASVQEIRQRLRGQRIETLRSRIEPLLAGRAGAEVWLFGSLARGDWDARSDVDLLAVARAVVGFADQQLGELAGPQAT
jgi:predicted nucleotidyltransferase